MNFWVWSKLASARWEDAWVERLAIVPPDRLIMSQKPGAKFLRIEAWMDSQPAASKLQRAFGGNIRSVKSDPKAFLVSPPSPPIRVGKRLWIFRNEEDATANTDDSAARLIVPANLAFGTGDHATTGMCLRALEEASRRMPDGWNFLDFGCGTGILALAAAQFGAGKVVGMDFDPVAVRVARANARQNRLRKVRFDHADVLEWKAPFLADLAVANLFSGLLIEALPRLKAALAPDAKLFLSGVLKSQEPEIRAALSRHKMELLFSRHKGKWCCLGTQNS